MTHEAPAPAAGVASLPMYDYPELAWAHRRLWTAVRARLQASGVPAPKALAAGQFDEPRDAWLAPDLLLGQACGWPLVTSLAGRVTVVGAFHYNVPEADGPTYRPVIVTAPGTPPGDLAALAGRRAAVNGFDSLSGWVNLRRAVLGAAPGPPGAAAGDIPDAPDTEAGSVDESTSAAPDGDVPDTWPGGLVLTGSHRASLEAIARGEAEVASIDAVTYALLARLRPELTAAVTVAGHGPRTPTLPLITAAPTRPDTLRALRAALTNAVSNPALADTRQALLITGFSPLDASAYAPLHRSGAATPHR